MSEESPAALHKCWSLGHAIPMLRLALSTIHAYTICVRLAILKEYAFHHAAKTGEEGILQWHLVEISGAWKIRSISRDTQLPDPLPSEPHPRYHSIFLETRIML